MVIIMNKVIIFLVTFISCFMLTGCKKNKIVTDYPSLNSDTIIRYTFLDEVMDKLNNNYTGIMMFGFKACPWCQAAISYVDEIAKEKGYEEVLYLDIKDMRDNTASSDHPKYLELLELLSDDIGNPEKIFAPTVIALVDGKVTGFNVGTVSSHEFVDGNLPLMTIEQIEELKEIYRAFF